MTTKPLNKHQLGRQRWLKLLKQAIDEGVKIQVNHRFTYKGKNLGTFLVEAKRRGKQELKDQIKEIGLDFKDHSNEPEDYLRRFIKELRNNPNPNKGNYITRFNTCILPKKDILKPETKKALEEAWKFKFGEERPWKKRDGLPVRIRKWKEFRYDKVANPKGKWFQPKSKMGELYFWAYARKRKPWLMEAILDQFNDKELQELHQEGFIKDEWLKK
jgi:hypothetical protein